MADWARDEGWNPGLGDAACFHAADPEGFLIGTLQGQPVGCISAIRYGAAAGFIGFYIMRPPWRGQGHGIRLWKAAMARLKRRSVGLDGVVAQQANYRKSGFVLAWNNARFAATQPLAPAASAAGIGPVTPADAAALDAHVFPAPRDAFWQAWLTAPGHVALGLRRDGALVGFGVIRPAVEGSKIGPLTAADGAAARALFAALLARAPAGPVHLDVPLANADAVAMAEAAGMVPVFETARMYAGPMPSLDLARLYGVASYELG